ncbi:MAG: B12-binding domain-containing radical SAM protein [Nanoarchaeota archaeon]|nr:B12-binding domain-containing radical SAM protein [Nanoarchaeota archaeon]
MTKKILLINPPQTFYRGCCDFNVYIPTSLLYLSSYLKKYNVDVEVELLDFVVIDFNEKIIGDKIQYGTSFDRIKEMLKNTDANIVAITSPFSTQFHNAVEVAEIARKEIPNALIVLGGPDASVRGKEILEKNDCFDISVMGEGEETFSIVCKIYEGDLNDIKNVKGIVLNHDGAIKMTPKRDYLTNLDSIPFPDYDLIDFNDYFHNKHFYRQKARHLDNGIGIITSRGCPFGCIFCSIHIHMGHKFRSHSPKYVIDHIALLKKKYGINNLNFEDDNLTFDIVRFEKILDMLLATNADIKWKTPNAVRADLITNDILEKMQNSGCTELTISIESADDHTRNSIIKKRLDIRMVIKVAEHCRKINLRCRSFYLVGFPGETIETMRKTLDFALDMFKRHHLIPRVHMVTPQFGTKLFEICKENNYFSVDINEKTLGLGNQLYGTPLIKTEEFDETDMKDLIKEYEDKYSKLSRDLRAIQPSIY